MTSFMNGLFESLWLAALLVFSSALWSAEMQLSTFLGSSPLQGLDVELDGVTLGVTDAQGGARAELSAGAHSLRLLKNGVPLTEFAFEVAEGENAEISLSFTDFEKPAEVAFDKYDPNAGGGSPGVVEGYVTDAEGYALPGATVRLDRDSAEGLSVVSDESGAFRLEAPRGLYTMSASHPDHATASPTELRILANVGVAASIALRPKSTEATEFSSESGLEGEGEAPLGDQDPGPATAAPVASEGGVGENGVQEITVVGRYRPTQRTTADLERFSAAVTDAISVDELLRFGDSDVAASLKRVVGISVTGGKYAVVRGLDGRYIAATLNGNLMPSTDPFRRDVELDLFPPEILGGIEIQKNFSAELPGETSGGIIKMATRDAPDSYINAFSASVEYVTDTTGSGFSSYKGSDTDFLGFDDGLRELPGAVDAATDGGLNFSICQIADQTGCISRERASSLAASLPNIYNPKREKADPNFELAYTLGNELEREIGNIGLYGTLSYENESKSRNDAVINDFEVSSNYIRDERQTSLNGYFVAGLESKEGWEVLSKTIWLRDTEDTVEVESGVNRNENVSFDNVLLEFVERQFLAQQFQGTHKFFGDRHTLNWRAGVSQTTRDSPDRRSYLYQGGTLAVSTVERSYSELTEDGLDFGLDYAMPFELSESVSTEVSVGTLLNTRKRDVELVRIGVRQGSNTGVALDPDLETLLSAENFANDAFRLNARSTTTDSYDADQDSIAFYAAAETDFGENFTLVTGLRQDDFTQDLSFPNDDSSAGLDSRELLPATSLIYRPRDDLQFRLSYAGTVSRPNITELAPSRFYDERGREYIGCPTCDASTIDNFDFRAEYYFEDKGSASIAIFTKEIDQPLERSIADGSGSATNALTFRNNQSAKVSGIELDLSKTLLAVEEHGVSIGANMAFIESEIKLDEIGRRLEIDPKRELQGQSPFLANLQLSYDHFPWRQKATLLANYFDDRIDIVTRNQPSIMEAGRLLLNFNYEKAFGSASKISFKLKNLLDEEVEYTQDGRTIESYKEGRELSLGYSLNFN